MRLNEKSKKKILQFIVYLIIVSLFSFWSMWANRLMRNTNKEEVREIINKLELDCLKKQSS